MSKSYEMLTDTPPDPETYFQPKHERHPKGTGMAVIAAEREARDAKTARLKAAREGIGWG